MVLILRTILTILLVWVLGRNLPQYVTLIGGIPAAVIVGSLLTLMNVLVRPLINAAVWPLKLFATLPALIISNCGFLWITIQIASGLNPKVVQFQVVPGVWNWVVVAFLLGIANWLLKHMLKH